MTARHRAGLLLRRARARAQVRHVEPWPPKHAGPDTAPLTLYVGRHRYRGDDDRDSAITHTMWWGTAAAD